MAEGQVYNCFKSDHQILHVGPSPYNSKCVQLYIDLHHANGDYGHQKLKGDFVQCSVNLMLPKATSVSFNVFYKIKPGSIVTGC